MPPRNKTNKPENRTNKPESRTNKPENRTNKPENRTNKPENRTNKPESRTNKPENRTNTKRRGANGRRGILLGVGLALALAAGWFGWQGFHKAPEIRNVLLISIDTCRADRLSCYGYSSKTTPSIDAIAAEATLFQNVYSPIPMTLPAHCSMLTGTNPPYHGVHDNAQYGFGGSGEATLADHLKARGFVTGGIVSSGILASRYGLDQGFDTYADKMPIDPQGKAKDEQKGGDTTLLALDFLERNRSKPFFLFLHYIDPHLPYDPPEPFRSQFGNSLYDGEIAYTDSCIGQVAAKLKELALYDSTLLIITGDHGEMLGEHGEKDHKYFIYEAALRVPLIVRQPRQKAGGVVRETVGLIDIVPTICGLLKTPPPGNTQGADLTPLLKGREMAEAGRSYYCESLTATKYGGNSLLGVVQGNWKYIQTTRPELYELEKDPREENNLVSGRPDLVSGLQGGLRAVLEREVRARGKGKSSELDPKALASLAALGYIRGSVVEDFCFAADKDDPKDLIGFHETYSQAHLLVGEGKFSEAKALYESLASQRPRYAGAYFSLAGIAFRQRDYAEAVRILPKAIELDPNDYLYPLYLGIALFKLNRLSEALVPLREAEKLEPRSSEVLANHGLALLRAKRVEEGAEKLQKAVRIDPHNDVVHQGLAQAYSLEGRADDAIAECMKALEINPANIEVQNNLGMLQYEKGDRPKALASWKESLRLNPDQAAVLEPAIRALLEEGQADQAHLWIESLLRLEPRNTRVMCRIALLKTGSKYPQLSDPAGSLVLARQAREISGDRDALSQYALAAALAALKKPAEAADAASQALGLAEEAGDTALVANIRELLEFCKRSSAGGGR